MYKKRDAYRIISKELRAGNKLAMALAKTELKSKTTFYTWMNKSPRLKAWVKGLESLCDERRNMQVEDAFFERLRDGKATGAEYFFYLTNRRPDRWQNNFKFGDTNNTIITNIKYVRVDSRNSIPASGLPERDALIESPVQGDRNRASRRED